MRVSLPDQQYLKECLDYDPLTGKLTWKERPLHHFSHHENPIRRWKAWNSKNCGKPAFTSKSKGYFRGTISCKYYLAHRIIFKWLYGTDPEYIDHINGDRSDNRQENLRSVSKRENNRNQSIYSNNTSGYTGVSWKNREGKWVVKAIDLDGKEVFGGYFTDLEEAVEARKALQEKLGYHANHGKAKKNEVNPETWEPKE